MGTLTLREILTKYNTHHKYGLEDDCLEETLRECFEVVSSEFTDEHRWYVTTENVCKIKFKDHVRYFEYTGAAQTHDNSWEDAGYMFEGIDNVVEVYPKEVTEIKYVYTIDK